MYYALGVFVALVLAFVLIYNSLVMKRNQVSNIESGVDTQLKRRYDLIPNLVASVKEYLVHEKSLLERITALRSSAQGAMTSEQKFDLNSEISGLMPNLKVAVENYPELKANENILTLQKSLNEVEEQISAARRAYNAAVTQYNNAVEMFPSNIVANLMNFKKAAFFKAPENERANHNVSELFKRD